MARILGIDLPKEKRMEVAIRYIYGIGPALGVKILAEAQINPNTRCKDLTEKDVANLTSVIQKDEFQVEGDLRREIQQNIKRLIDIRSYRGTRHIRGLPCRGQRTHTNSRTRKGPKKTIGGLSRKAPAPK